MAAVVAGAAVVVGEVTKGALAKFVEARFNGLDETLLAYCVSMMEGELELENEEDSCVLKQGALADIVVSCICSPPSACFICSEEKIGTLCEDD